MKTLEPRRRFIRLLFAISFFLWFLPKNVSALVISGWFIVITIVVALVGGTAVALLRNLGKFVMFFVNLLVDYIVEFLSLFMAPAIRSLLHMIEGMIKLPASGLSTTFTGTLC